MRNAWKKSHKNSHYGPRSRILFLLPSLLGVCIFVLFPFLNVIRRSFLTAVTGVFCGLENYATVFKNEAFGLAVQNTIRFVVVGLPILILTSLFLSLAIYKSRYVQELKSAFLFPLAVPAATVVLIWKLFFYKNGMINDWITSLGGRAVDWLGSDAAFWVLIISYVWKNLGYTIVLWITGLKNISSSLIEAAKVDGATEFRCLIHIVMPGLKPMLFTITILSFLNSFKVFREAYLVAGAYPQEKMYLLQHLFNNWFTSLDMDKLAAAAVCIAVVFAVFVMLLLKSWDEQDQ